MAKNEFHQLLVDFACSSQHVVRETASRLLLEYLQLILYQRSQIPEPIQIIQRKIRREKLAHELQHKNGQRKKAAESQYMKKCKQLLGNMEELKNCINDLVEHLDEIEAVVIIGPTAVSTKEAFAFKTAMEDIPGKDAIFDEETVSSHARKFCMLMVQAPLYGRTELTLTNTRLFVRVKKATLSNTKPWPRFRYPIQKCCLSVKVNFKSTVAPLNVLSDSFISSTGELNMITSPKEINEVDLHPPHSQSFSNPVTTANNQSCKNDKDSVKDFNEFVDSSENRNPKQRPALPERTRKLSAIDALNAVLAQNDVENDAYDDENEKDDVCSKTDKFPDAADELIWHELPVVIRGFKF